MTTQTGNTYTSENWTITQSTHTLCNGADDLLVHNKYIKFMLVFKPLLTTVR